MNANRWLKVSIPVQGLLLLSQLVTGLNVDRIPDATYRIVHLGGGSLLVALVLIHVGLNWGWVRTQYRRKPAPAPTTPPAGPG